MPEPIEPSHHARAMEAITKLLVDERDPVQLEKLSKAMRLIMDHSIDVATRRK
jgi:hypothetical protein